MTRRRRRKQPAQPPVEKADAVEIPIDEAASDEAGVEASAPEAPESAAEDAPEGEAPVQPTAEERVRELEDRVKRLQAEFLNETKRIARQAEDGRKFAVESLVRDLLPVFDALHSARSGIESGAGEGAAKAVREGLDLVERELLNVLGRHGVERIEAARSAFDPALHEALFVVDDADLPPNTVAQVLRPGFTLRGRVVRAAHVAVTRSESADDEAPETEGADDEADESANRPE